MTVYSVIFVLIIYIIQEEITDNFKIALIFYVILMTFLITQAIASIIAIVFIQKCEPGNNGFNNNHTSFQYLQ